MKKEIVLFMMFAYIANLFIGYSPQPTQPDPNDSEKNVARFENTTWQVASIAAEDYDIRYDASETDYSRFPLDKLVAYFLNSDGAYAEGSSSELYRRFLEAPNIMLTYIALVGDNSTRNGVPAGDELCRAIASADVFWYDTADAFSDILEQYGEIYQSGSTADILACLKYEHEAAVVRRK